MFLYFIFSIINNSSFFFVFLYQFLILKSHLQHQSFSFFNCGILSSILLLVNNSSTSYIAS